MLIFQVFLLSKIVLCRTFLQHEIFGGIVNRTIFLNVENSDKMVSCHCREIWQTSKKGR